MVFPDQKIYIRGDFLKESGTFSIQSKVYDHLSGRVSLLGASLLNGSKAVGHVALGAVAVSVYCVSLGSLKRLKNYAVFSIETGIEEAILGLNFLLAAIDPRKYQDGLKRIQKQNFSPEARNWRIQEGAKLIAAKLEKQWNRAQNQPKKEEDGPFIYQTLPEVLEKALTAHLESLPGYEVGVCHFIGRRWEMEDQHLVSDFTLSVAGKEYPVKLFGVFDGHGGEKAAIYLKENLEKELHKTLSEFCAQGLADEVVWNALKITFVRLTTEFKELESGSTATVAMILDGNLWTANVGDSRTILDTGAQLSEDAKPTDSYYRRGIEHRGGTVIGDRINGILAVARAIGDHSVGAVNARPKITKVPLSEIPSGTHLVLTCDGVYDVAATRQVAQAVREHRDQGVEQIAKNIVGGAYLAGSGDNLSALVVKLP